MSFFFEVAISGMLSGLMYSLVALGFVLIYKASGVFNFAQGMMVYFAALAVVFLTGRGWPLWAAIACASGIMLILSLAIERLVLRKLVGQPRTSLFIATLGIGFFLQGLGPLLFGSDVRGIDLGIVDEPIATVMEKTGLGISKFDLFASAVVVVLAAILGLLFQKTKIGRALRAVADDHQAAQSLGVALQTIWCLAWGMAGLLALIAGVLWGARNGVQFALTMTALKALPVLILGGFTSIPGAIVGGMLIGTSEKLAEIYLPPLLQGWSGSNAAGIESWFPYVFALLFLLVRPEGLFGEKHMDRV